VPTRPYEVEARRHPRCRRRDSRAISGPSKARALEDMAGNGEMSRREWERPTTHAVMGWGNTDQETYLAVPMSREHPGRSTS